MSHKKGAPLFSIVILVGLMIGGVLFGAAPMAYAADGSGTNTVSPTSTDYASTGNEFTFTFTAAETMNSGGISIEVPSGWSAPQGTAGTAGYTTATSTAGMVGSVINNADSATGWVEDDGDSCVTFAADATNKYEGAGSIECLNAAVNTPDDTDSFQFRYGSNQNWSAYTKIGVWLHSTVAMDATNYIQVGYIGSANDLGDGAALQVFNVQTLAANTWTYYTFDLTAARAAVRGVGIICKGAGCDLRDIHVDYLLIGPGSPTFSGSGPWTVNVPFVAMATSSTSTVVYGNGGGTSGVTAPAVEGAHTFTTKSRFDASGTLTDIASHPTITVGNQVPVLTSIAPTSTEINSGTTTITLTGSKFVASSVARWNGSDRTTSFINSTTLEMTVPPSDLTTVGTSTITVFNPTPGGGTSSGQSFVVRNRVPTVTSLSPNEAFIGDATTTVTVTGENFVSGAAANWNGSARTTVFVNSTTIDMTVTAIDLATAGTSTVTVTNPTPGGGTSTTSAAFVVKYRTPTITSNTPDPVYVNETSILTITGTNYYSTSVVKFAGTTLSSTTTGSTSITATLPAATASSTGAFSLTVTNPTPGGGTAATTTNVHYRSPTLDSIVPSTAIAGASGATSTVTGTGFAPATVVNWSGSPRTTTYASSTQVLVFFTTSDFSTATSASITATNPTPGGGTSNTLTFTVLNPSPTTVSISPTSTFIGDATTTITITGTGFNAQSIARYNGSNRTTNLINSTTLEMTLPASDMETATDTPLITVFNPTPGGGTSNAQTFSVRYRFPTLTSISPISATVGDSGFTMTATGTGFVNGATVLQFAGSARSTTVTSSTTLTASILTSDLTTSGAFDITIFNPTPGGGTSTAQTFTVNKANITITLGSSLNPSTYGDSVTFTATTTSGVGTPSGTVTFKDGSVSIATSTLSGGVATLATSSLSVGVHSITAVYNGDSSFNASTSVAVSQTVNKANITITLGSSLNPSTYGDSVTFTATTTGTFGVPSGTVTFFDGATPLATSTLSSGIATLATSSLVVGVHSITAVYNGDATYNASTSASVSQTVNKANITITLGSSLNPSTFGDSVTFTATTTSAVSTPTGTITFFDGATPLATSTISGGVATLATSSLSVGTHSITAIYNGDTNFNASTSAEVSQVVNKANITITLGSSLNPSTYGDSVTFTATTTGTFGSPSGTVTFKDDGIAIATSTLSGGVATLSTSTLIVGTHSITAVYNGDTMYNASTSAAVSQVVNKANITIALGSSLNPSTYGDSVIFTATTTAVAGTPTGTVTFKDDGIAIATSTLSGGVATLATSSLIVGTHSITAIYNGDANFNASTSAAVSQVVTKANATITLGSSLNPSIYGDSVTFTATTTGAIGTPTGTVTFKNGGVAFATSTLTSGVAATATSTLSAATHSITATYNGDSNYNASTSATVSQVVNNPVPVITLLSPDNAEEGSATTSLVISGSLFVPSVSVTFAGTPLVIDSSSSSTINTSIPASLLATFSTSTVAVTNPAPGGGTATSSFIVTRSAVRFVIIDPTDGTVDAPITVTVVAQKENGATSTNYQSDVTLNTSGSATGGGLINIINGVGTTTISDTVAETVTLSLTDSQTTGLDVTSTQQVIFGHGAVSKFTLSGPATLDAGNRAAFTATRKDQFNNLVTTGPNTTAYFYTTSTSTSAKFYDAATGGSIVTSALISSGTSTANVWYYDEEPGTYTITVSDNATSSDGNVGIDDATSTITVQAVATRFVIIDPTDGTVDAPITVTVQAQDNLGHIDANYQSDVTLLASSTSGQATTTNNGLVNIINGVGTINVSDTVAETVSLSLSDTQGTGLNVASSTQNVVFAPGAIAKFAFGSVTNTPQDTRLQLTVFRRDQYDNNVIASSTTAYLYASPTSTSNNFFDASTGGTQTNVLTIANGFASSSIWYGGNPLASLGTFTLTVSDNATSSDGNVGIDDTSTSTTITPVATQLIVLDPTDGTVDAAITVNVEARDDNNNVVTSYNGSATLAVTGNAVLASAGAITFADGRATTTLTDQVAPQTVTISIVASSTTLIATSTQSVTIGVGALSQFTLTDPGNAAAGTLVEYTATRKDQYGNVITTGSVSPSLLVSPTTTQGVFYASNSTSSSQISSLTFSSGESAKQFWYYNETAGTYQLTVQSGSVVGNDSITINPAAVAKFTMNDRVTTNPGGRLQYTIVRKDAFNNLVTSGSLTAYMYASATSTNTAFYDAATNGNVVSSIAISDAQSSANVWYYETQTGTYTITASDNASAPDGATGLLDATDSVSVQTATATRFVFASVTPSSLTAGNASVVTIEARDDFGNLDTNYQTDVTLVTGVSSVSGTGLSSGQAVIDIVNGIGSITLTDNIAEVVSLALSDSQSTGLNVSAVSSITWTPGATSQFVVNDPGDIVAGNRIGYTVSRKDQYGNYVTAGSDTIYLYSDSVSSNKAFYTSSTTTSTAQFVTITAAASSTQFWYYDDTAGTYTITASDNATTPDGTTNIDDGTDQLVVSAAPIVATRYVILDPQDVAVGQSTVITIKTQDNAGALDNTQQEDIYLVFSTSSISAAGIANSEVLISITDGVGTVIVTDTVIETVSLSLRRIPGSTSTLAITSTQNVAFSASAPAPTGGGFYGGVPPQPVAIFTGRAYPGAKIILFARTTAGDIPLERDIEVRADGTFTIDFTGALRGLEAFGLSILDANGRVAQTKIYTMNKVTAVTAEKNLYIAPTTGVVQRTVTIGNNVGITGSAAPGSVIRAEVDGKPVDAEVVAGKNGTYRLLINTKDLAYGGHVVRAKQIDKNGVESDWSPLKVFNVTRALVTRADLNNNGGVDIGDWSIFLTKFGSSNPEVRRDVDINNDGKVDISDFSIFIRSTVNR